MQLYVARHGLAVPKDENPNCPLSKTGQRDVARMASFLARTCPSIKRIIHSGKTRAAQTALIYSETLGSGRIVEEASVGLAPGDPTDPVISALLGWNEDTMLVSHLPLVGKLVARLVSGDESRDIVKFQAGAVTCLRHAESNRGWTLAWAVNPELLGS
ncbi:MAG: phosphohistidine phosphatase SixA [Pseudomonadota bacterium]|nr:phosphohistidine phosphatase SixA [Pseudomonadota bacterium]